MEKWEEDGLRIVFEGFSYNCYYINNLFFYLIMQYFNEVIPLEAERLKTLHIQWAQYYLKVRNQAQDLGKFFNIFDIFYIFYVT